MDIKLDCECHCEILRIEYWNDDMELCISRYIHAPYKDKYGLWERIKFFFTGQHSYHEIILSKDKAKQLADFINTNL